MYPSQFYSFLKQQRGTSQSDKIYLEHIVLGYLSFPVSLTVRALFLCHCVNIHPCIKHWLNSLLKLAFMVLKTTYLFIFIFSPKKLYFLQVSIPCNSVMTFKEGIYRLGSESSNGCCSKLDRQRLLSSNFLLLKKKEKR